MLGNMILFIKLIYKEQEIQKHIKMGSFVVQEDNQEELKQLLCSLQKEVENGI